MSLETAIDRLAAALERVAAVAEAAPSRGAEKNVTPAKETAAAKSSEKPAKPKKGAAKETPPADDEGYDDVPKATIEQVRAALNTLQAAKGSAEVKELLKKFDAPALSKLPVDKYQEVIDQATKDAEEE